jgi:flagellar M-ring protein FliF
MDQAKKLLSALNGRQLLTIVICAAAVVGGVVWFSYWQRESGFRPLYTSLAPEDASAMVQKLRETGVDYKISENGTTLLAPEARIPELRLEMAGLGLPKTGRIGFEIFDKTNFGITDFAEHVNFRRAMEGELERSVMALAVVQQARVHVSLPKESVFTDTREAAKASVLVGLRPGARLTSQNVIAITNLVSSAVEGLAPESVSVVDMNGNLLSRARRDTSTDGVEINEAALAYRQAIEHDLAVKISNTLDPLLGADKFRSGVSADVDMTSGEQSEETYDPTKTVMLTSQKTEDTSGTTRSSPAAGGPPGTAANLPQQAAARPAGNTTNTSKRSENITYQSSRTVKHVKLAQGAIKKLSIAVLVDQGAKWEGQGKLMHRVGRTPDTEKLKAIQSLVATLVGLNPERGDQLTVEALPFDTSVNMEIPTANGADPVKKTEDSFSLEALKKKPALLWGSVAGAVFVLAMVAFVFTRGRRTQQSYQAPEALPAPVSPAPLQPGMPAAIDQAYMASGDRSRIPALMPSRTEVLISQLQENGKNNPAAWAGVLRGWLSEEEAS